MRDLTDASPAAIAAERARVPREGIGAEILARQGSDGSWHRADAPVWLPTLYTMLLLRATGVDRAEPAVESAVARLEAGFRWDEEFRDKRSRSSRARWSRASTGARSRLAPTSGARRRASRAVSSASSSTTAVGTAKRRRARARRSTPRSACWRGYSSTSVPSGPAPEIAAARRRGEEYLLERALFRRLSTGEVANPAFLKFAFPPRYHYDVLRALDYLRDAGVQPDARIGDALHVVESRQQADGRWLLDDAHDEALAFPFGESVGEPSRWNTLRALRVLRWYER